MEKKRCDPQTAARESGGSSLKIILLVPTTDLINQHSPCPTGFSEDPILNLGQIVAPLGLVGCVGRCPLLWEMVRVTCSLPVPIRCRASLTFLLQVKTFPSSTSFQPTSQHASNNDN